MTIRRGALEPVEPPGWRRGSGYSHGMLAPAGGRVLFIAGQVGWDQEERLAGPGFVEQFERALANVMAVLAAAGGAAHHLGRLTVYVVDRAEYLEALAEVGAIYRRVVGRHFPAMALVEVAALLEPDARVEIEATAVLPAATGEQE